MSGIENLIALRKEPLERMSLLRDIVVGGADSAGQAPEFLLIHGSVNVMYLEMHSLRSA